MKLIVAIIRPEKLNDVLEALFRADVRGVTVTRVEGHGGEVEPVGPSRGAPVEMGVTPQVRRERGGADAGRRRRAAVACRPGGAGAAGSDSACAA